MTPQRLLTRALPPEAGEVAPTEGAVSVGDARWGQLPRAALAAAVLALGLALSACSGTGNGGASAEATEVVLVSAAASLTDAFDEMEASFELANPGVDVVLNPGGSSVLREQILEGAPADVFASADVANMERIVVSDGTVGLPTIFATNRMQIAVPVGNPGEVSGLDDLGSDRLLIGLCAVGVPCGDAARTILASAGVDPAVDTNEPNVRALLTKIGAGELDAGLVYVTDVAAAADEVMGIIVPAELNVVGEYPIVVLSGGANRRGAEDFVSFVLSAAGRAILSGLGFGSP